jgi:hypothetical protein
MLMNSIFLKLILWQGFFPAVFLFDLRIEAVEKGV